MMPEPDPILESLRTAVRARLRAADDPAASIALRKMNALAMEAPVEMGGMGLGLAAGCAIAEELGRAALPSRFLAASMLIDAARSVEAGGTAVCIAGFERARLLVDDETSVLAPVGDAIVLFGPSELDIVPVKDPSGATAIATPIGSGTKLGDLEGELPEGAVGRARIRQAAYLLGHAHGALTCGVGHASRRKQFGQALRDFQGVGFRLANAYVSLEALRLAVARAIRSADTGQPFGRQAAEVLAQAAETASELAHVSMQVCGVRGMTELPVSKHYVRIRREAARLGRPTDLWRALGLARLSGAAGFSRGEAGPPSQPGLSRVIETTRSVSDPNDALVVGQ